MARQVTGATYGRSIYPHYDAASLGFRGYWYPATFARRVRRRPVALLICGEPVVLVREGGRVHALRDRCPHRGIPLSAGVREFPGTITCRYHGWTFDLATGALRAALTDGPDSPVCGSRSVAVPTLPTAERCGLIWVYVGDGVPPPLEEHLPSEFLRPGGVLVGRITEQRGDWRHAAENGFDEGHAKYLHRHAPWKFLRYIPGWSAVRIRPTEDGRWLTRDVVSVGQRGEFPGLGWWPPRPSPWRRSEGRPGMPAPRVSIRLPGLLRVEYPGRWTHFEWYVPTEEGRYRYLQLIHRTATPLGRRWMRLWYWCYLRWIYHVHFFNQDISMIRLMRTPPEQLYRPDVSLVGWRRLCEQAARGEVLPDRDEERALAYEAAGVPERPAGSSA